MKYSAKAGDSLKNIVLNFFKEGTPLGEANNSLIITMKKNPSITSWNPLKSDVVFKLYLDPKITELEKYNQYSIRYKEKEIHHLNIFSTPSIGFFSQSNLNGYTVKYNQISLISLGINYLYAPFKSNYNLSLSTYYSTLSSTSNQIGNGSNALIDIPSEYGANIYGIYRPDKSQFSFFTGIDYESFSSFNLENILNNSIVAIDTNEFIYMTIGTNIRPTKFERYTFKFSISKSVVTNSTSTIATTETVKFSGIKFISLVNYQISEVWSVQGMFKVHNFTGNNNLSVKRFGAGISYSLF